MLLDEFLMQVQRSRALAHHKHMEVSIILVHSETLYDLNEQLRRDMYFMNHDCGTGLLKCYGIPVIPTEAVYQDVVKCFMEVTHD